MKTEVLWGKSGYDPSLGDAWSPLWLHLADSISVSEWLWDCWVSSHIKKLILLDLNLSESEGKQLLSWLSGMHDIGKATPDFGMREGVALRTHRLYDRMRNAGFSHPNLNLRLIEGKNVRHEVMSAGIVQEKMTQQDGIPVKSAKTATSILAGHHGNPLDINYQEVKRLLSSLGSPWRESQNKLFDFVNERTQAYPVVLKVAHKKLSSRAQILLTGLVIMSDWLASSEEYFPLLPFDQVPVLGDMDLIQSRKIEAVSNITLPSSFDSSHLVFEDSLSERIEKRFSFRVESPTSIQEGLVSVASNPDHPVQDIFIAEASMGQGKTEAALLAAEVLLKRGYYSGVFFGLPTMATTEAVYSRIVPYVEQLAKDSKQRLSCSLLHSQDSFSKAYSSVRRKNTGKDKYGLEPEGWFRGKRQRPLNSYVISTIDTFLMMSLKVKYNYWRHLGFAGKVLILDEVHSADAYMDAYLFRSIEWAGFYGNPVIVLTATLSPDKRIQMLEAYQRGQAEGKKLWQE